MRITDRDGLAVANVDYRHPHAVDVDAVSALVDCHPLFAGEPQYEVHRRDPPATTVVEAEIRPAVVTDRDVAARQECVACGSNPHGQRGSERLGPHGPPPFITRRGRSMVVYPSPRLSIE
ncbi:hypothetical protein AWC32_05005 [Mycobacterium xenopi]|nr:hypothetical protein AWC32_05005 [Mycobacterium xenopi]